MDSDAEREFQDFVGRRAGARRRRRHAMAGVVALVAVLAAAAVTVPTVVLHQARTQAAAPALGRFVVAGYPSPGAVVV